MLRIAVDLDSNQIDADLRPHQPRLQRFGNESRIGAVAPLQAGERAVAGAFLFDNRLR